MLSQCMSVDFAFVKVFHLRILLLLYYMVKGGGHFARRSNDILKCKKDFSGTVVLTEVRVKCWPREKEHEKRNDFLICMTCLSVLLEIAELCDYVHAILASRLSLFGKTVHTRPYRLRSLVNGFNDVLIISVSLCIYYSGNITSYYYQKELY